MVNEFVATLELSTILHCCSAYVSYFTFTKNVLILASISIASILVGMMVAVAQPYKSKVYNTVDIVLILSFGISWRFISLIADTETSLQIIGSEVILILPFTFPFIYVPRRIYWLQVFMLS